MLEFAVILPSSPIGPASGLYRSLVAFTSAWKPEDLLHYLMQHDLVRPTFEVERKTRIFSHCADLLKATFLDDSTTEKLSLTTGLLKTLQKRLEDPQLTSFRSSANPAGPQKMLVMHCAFVDVCETQLITFNRLRLDVTVTPNQRSGPFSKLREAKNSVELRAAWEKREFCPRTSSSPSSYDEDASNNMKDWLQSGVNKHDTGARDLADCPSDDPPPPSYESLFHGSAIPYTHRLDHPRSWSSSGPSKRAYRGSLMSSPGRRGRRSRAAVQHRRESFHIDFSRGALSHNGR
ncbi:hypothetical protein FA13DRAFT_338647 [Coprinellus micaceus]|uniref:Uncharacterized protein n=1 Tax=Coprinellus micaceus TaxID=71717 RepID=A0A4Y7TCL5_COPMI|nr:hypothetical protein FA13DRAFT_338647 [Coprinellus micaceus]